MSGRVRVCGCCLIQLALAYTAQKCSEDPCNLRITQVSQPAVHNIDRGCRQWLWSGLDHVTTALAVRRACITAKQSETAQLRLQSSALPLGSHPSRTRW